MHHRTPARLIKCALVCALALAGAASGAAPDQDKFRLLSCDTASAKAGDWLNQSAPANAEDAQIIAGPVTLGKACVKNVSVVASFGVLMVQGQICNARLEEFTDALAAIGTTLNKDVKDKAPGVVMGKEEGRRAYFITDRLVDMKTGKPVPMDGKYAFICTVSEGGPQ